MEVHLPIAFLAGLISFLSPCVLPLIPGYICYISGTSLDKLVKKRRNLSFDIEVDGGINFSNSKTVVNAGANILVSGTTIFKENNGDIKKNIDFLRLP